jgi:EmrB/QacA subfamily drug resistance transporter
MTQQVAGRDGASPPEGAALDSRAGRWILAVTVLGSGMALLDSTVVNVALPRLGHDLHASTSSLQWVLNGYLLTLASLILLGGSLGDRYGRRRIFTLGAGVFTAASLLCAIAPSSGLLIAARLLQGVGGALLTPTSLAIIEATFRPADRARAIGAWSGLGGAAAAIGPLLGGYLVGALSWRAAFLINLPLGIIVIAIARRHLPESRDPTSHGRLDFRGAGLAALGLAGITYALIEGPGSGMSATAGVAGAVGVLGLAAFLQAERRARNPMMPLGLFASRQFSAANAVTFVVYAALGGMLFLLVAFLQVSLDYSPLAAGAATLPLTALMLALSAPAGSLAQRIGPRIPLTVGPLVVAAGMLLLARIDPGDRYITGVLPGIVVFGLGLTLVVAPVTATVLAAADVSRAGIASAVNNAVARIAGLIAVAVLPLLAGLTGTRFYQPAAMTHGFHVAASVCAGLAAVGGILAWVAISDDALEAEPQQRGEPPVAVSTDFTCAVGGPPLRRAVDPPQTAPSS